MAEMTALEYLKEKNRMTKACRIVCDKCPLAYVNNGEMVTCGYLERYFPEKTIEIVQKWSEEHPVKTMLQDFLEKYPNAPKDHDGMPEFCPGSLGYQNDNEHCEGSDNYKCVNCWNRPLEE